MNHISTDLLHDVCSVSPNVMSAMEARRILAALGGFARWSVDPKVFRIARADLPARFSAWMETAENQRPELPTAHGSCWIPIVQSDLGTGPGGGRFPALLSAFPFPVRWVAGRDHSERLPPDIRRLAVQVLNDLRVADALTENDEWGLQFPTEECQLGDCDFSRLTALSADSGWVPLAAGLLAALLPDGSGANPAVWSSGAWSRNGGIIPITGERRKALVAADFGARRIYFPDTNDRRLQVPEVQNRIQTVPLTQSERHPKKCLARLIKDFNLLEEPDESEPLDVCAKWHFDHQSILQATEFYKRRLIPMEVDHARDLGYPQLDHITHIVALISNRPETIHLTRAWFSGRQPVQGFLLLYTDHNAEIQRTLLQFQGELIRDGVNAQNITAVPFKDDPSNLNVFTPIIHRWINENQLDPANVVLDFTPGKKWMTLALIAAAPTGSCLHYWENDSRPGDQRVYSNRKHPCLWTAGKGLTLSVSDGQNAFEES